MNTVTIIIYSLDITVLLTSIKTFGGGGQFLAFIVDLKCHNFRS